MIEPPEAVPRSAAEVSIPGVWATSDDRRRARGWGLLAAVLLGAVCLFGAVLEPARLLAGYLIAFVVVWCLALGCLGLLMLGHIAQGAWTVALRRTFEAGARTIWAVGVLFLPILLGLEILYPWARPAGEPGAWTHARDVYMSRPFFAARAVIYFVIWALLASRLSRMTARQETAPDPALPHRMRRTSAVGILLYAITVTMAAVDWMMSLAPRWWSTIYGLYVMAGQACSAMALGTLVGILLHRRRGRALLPMARFHDFGRMLLAFVMVWAYFAFSQYVILWSANLPEEVTFFVRRATGGFYWLSFVLVLLHFAVPFLALIGRDLKSDLRRLGMVCALLLVMGIVDVFWLVAPAFPGAGMEVRWLDLAALGAVLGLWTFLFVRELGKHPLLPLGDPELREALSNG
ncbi:MAG: hypothetical protein R3F14_06080 [Polyangiaceae bacterium]